MQVNETTTTESNDQATSDSASESHDSSVEKKSASKAHASDETTDDSETLETEASDDSEGEEQKDSEKKKSGNGVQKRIGKLTGKLSRAQEELEFWKAEALKTKNSKADDQAKPQRSETQDDAKPNPDNYDSHEKYVEDLADWKVEQKLKARDESAKQVANQTAEEKRVKAFQDNVKEFAKSHEDFEETIADLDDYEMSMTVRQVLVEAENGPALMYELGKNPEEYARICRLPAIDAARALGRIEARLAKESEKPAVKKTNAPPPLKPLGARSGAVSKSIYDPDLSFAEHERLRTEQLKSKR